jgi:hypothetical protein
MVIVVAVGRLMLIDEKIRIVDRSNRDNAVRTM